MAALVPRGKKLFLLGMVVTYVVLGGVFWHLANIGVLSPVYAEEYILEGEELFEPLPLIEVKESLQAAKHYTQTQLVRENGHVDVYVIAHPKGEYQGHDETNSEAMSYYLLWTANAQEKEAFDRALDFIIEHMIHPQGNFAMWRLESDSVARGEGQHIASDADIRMIKALFIAEEQWGDARYTDMIVQLTDALEAIAITEDGMLSPSAGYTVENYTWTSEEVYLSYADYTVFSELEKRRGQPWKTLGIKMKEKTVNAQNTKHLYLSKLTDDREYSNDIDGQGHSINSLWMLVRSAESGDEELQEYARDSLAFYEERFIVDGELFGLYNGDGAPLSPRDTPWAYALVARAAIHLDEMELADKVIKHLIEEKQVRDPDSPLFGAFPEGYDTTLRVGQFTMQEIILTLQDYVAANEAY